MRAGAETRSPMQGLPGLSNQIGPRGARGGSIQGFFSCAQSSTLPILCGEAPTSKSMFYWATEIIRIAAAEFPVSGGFRSNGARLGRRGICVGPSKPKTGLGRPLQGCDAVVLKFKGSEDHARRRPSRARRSQSTRFSATTQQINGLAVPERDRRSPHPFRALKPAAGSA